MQACLQASLAWLLLNEEAREAGWKERKEGLWGGVGAVSFLCPWG